MKIILPILGRSTDNISHYKKGLIEIERKMILKHIYDFLAKISNADFVAIISKDDIQKYYFNEMLQLLIPGIKIVITEGETSGAICSCLLAVEEICEEEPVIIVGSNQMFSINPQIIVSDFINKNYDGGLVIFEDLQPHWSYAKLDNDDKVIETAAKRTISKNATAGFYYFKKGSYFIESAKNVIKKNASINGNYYVSSCYNEMILNQMVIGTYRIQKQDYFHFDNPQDLIEFEQYLKEKKKNENK